MRSQASKGKEFGSEFGCLVRGGESTPEISRKQPVSTDLRPKYWAHAKTFAKDLNLHLLYRDRRFFSQISCLPVVFRVRRIFGASDHIVYCEPGNLHFIL